MIQVKLKKTVTMKKILFVHSVGELGGAERMSLSLIENLPKSDFTCLLATPETGEFTSKVTAAGADCLLYDAIQPSFSSPLKTLKNSHQWRKILSKISPDVIHTADLLSTRSISGVADRLGIPIIFHAHFPFSLKFAQWALRKPPKKIVFCSTDLLNCHKEILDNCSAQSELEVIHNGVNTQLFAPVVEKNSRPKVGIIANLQERKGHKEFLEMVSIVNSKGIEAEFHIIGGDIMQEPREPLLKQLSQDLNIADKVVFHGQVSDVKPILGNLDILVCASYEEAFPVSILEAMAMRKAIVSTNVNGIPEAIEHEKSGLLVKPRSSHELAKGVIRLLRDSELRDTLASNAMHRVRNNFSVESYIAKWALCYRACH